MMGKNNTKNHFFRQIGNKLQGLIRKISNGRIRLSNKKVTLPSLIFLAIIAVAISLFMGDENNNDGENTSVDESHGERIEVTLDEHIDGDTTKFNYRGSSETFRYLIIDTPETKNSRHGEEPLGQEASDRVEELLTNAGRIEIEFDEGPKQDDYDRNLVYVYADDVMINELLVREGLADVKYANPPNVSYIDMLEAAEEKAKSENLGIWSLN